MARTAILIKSYLHDLERLGLFLASIRAGNLDGLPVYLIIPEREHRHFRPLVSEGVEVVFEEELVFSRYTQEFCYKDSRLRQLLRRSPILRRLMRRPCYFGDLVQQLCKLALPAALRREVENFVILDSDLFFLREFEERDFVSEAGPVLIEQPVGPDWEETRMGLWIKTAKRLLGVEDKPFEPLNHIHTGTCWRSFTVHEMLERIEEINSLNWQDALMSLRPRETYVATDWTTDFFSEFELYGTYHRYLARTKQPTSPRPLCLNLWSEEECERLFSRDDEGLGRELSGYLLIGLQKGLLGLEETRAALGRAASALGRPGWPGGM